LHDVSAERHPNGIRSVTKETIGLSRPVAKCEPGIPATRGRTHKAPRDNLIARHTMHSNKSYLAALLVIVIASALIAKAAVVITGVAV